eukprot:g6919.t1
MTTPTLPPPSGAPAAGGSQDHSANPSSSTTTPAGAVAPAQKKESTLQRETRLTGHAELLQFVAAELTKQYQIPNPGAALARKVVSRFCQAKTVKDFQRKIQDYCVGNDFAALALFAAVETRVKSIDAEFLEAGSGASNKHRTDVLAGSGADKTQLFGGLQVRKLKQNIAVQPSSNNEDGTDTRDSINSGATGVLGDILYVQKGSTLGLDQLARQKRQRERKLQPKSMTSGVIVPGGSEDDEEDDDDEFLNVKPKAVPGAGTTLGAQVTNSDGGAGGGPRATLGGAPNFQVGGSHSSSAGAEGALTSAPRDIDRFFESDKDNKSGAGIASVGQVSGNSSVKQVSGAAALQSLSALQALAIDQEQDVDDGVRLGTSGKKGDGKGKDGRQVGGGVRAFRGARAVVMRGDSSDEEEEGGADGGKGNKHEIGNRGPQHTFGGGPSSSTGPISRRSGGAANFSAWEGGYDRSNQAAVNDDFHAWNVGQERKDRDFYNLQGDVLGNDEQGDDLSKKMQHEIELDEYEEQALDRDWYDGDENGMSTNSVFGQQLSNNELFEKEEKRKKEAELLRDKKISLEQMQRNAASEEWEKAMMRQAGVGERRFIDLDAFHAENYMAGARQHVVVKETIPPFLDGRISYTTQAEMVSVVKDPTSDMAVLAKKGCMSLKKLREEEGKNKMKDRFWEVNNAKMGDLMKQVLDDKAKAAEEAAAAESGERDEKKEGSTEGAPGGATASRTGDVNAEEQAAVVADNTAAADDDGVSDDKFDYRAENRFATAMNKIKLEAQTDFGRNKTLDEVRKALPVYSVRQEFLDLLREHQILIAVGETGSGKTTQLTQYLYEAGYTGDNLIIGCTQPRRMAAMSVAKRVSEEKHQEELGMLVGYSIRFEDCTSEHTRIKYMTDGVLLRETLNDADLEKYSVVVMDEAHERSLNTDVLFGILKSVTARRRDFRLIVTSATMDSNRFAQFFGGVPVFHIPGRTFPVDTFFSKSAAQDYVDAAVQQALQIHVTQERGDILIFMTGQEDIDATCTLLADRLSEISGGDNEKNKCPPLQILPVYSTMPSDLQARIFAASPFRKAIVATNIAETSLTVDGVRYVIDTGFCKLKVFDPKIGMDSLQVTPISQANANQRRGRAGRTEPGCCWRLYTERAFVAEMYEMSIPEIQRTNLSQVVLLLKSLGVVNRCRGAIFYK